VRGTTCARQEGTLERRRERAKSKISDGRAKGQRMEKSGNPQYKSRDVDGARKYRGRIQDVLGEIVEEAAVMAWERGSKRGSTTCTLGGGSALTRR